MANYNSDYTGAQIDSAVSRANSTDVTAGTIAASKAVVVDSNKDITGFRHITATGTVTAANVSLTGNVDLGGSPFDINEDGTVDVRDLVKFNNILKDFDLIAPPTAME